MDQILGQLMLFGGNFAPRGWAQCNGQLMPIAPNQALFSILGVTYGGDGITTFALPDLRGRICTHPGQGPGLKSVTLGQMYGSANNTLNATNLPPHNHIATAGTVNIEVSANDDEDNDNPVGSYLRKQSTSIYSNTSNANMGALASNTTTTPSGGNQPLANTQPTLGLTYCIALTGIYPSRN